MKRFKIKVLLIIGLLFSIALGIFGSNYNNVSAATNTTSDYVNTVTDLKTTDLLGSATLYEQKMSSLLNGNSAKSWQEHYVQWVDTQNLDSLKLVTWTNQSQDSWTAATTKKCAEDWEKSHPGWIVVAGINGDFFQNSAPITWEPTNNFMADGDMYRGDYLTNANYRGTLGFTDNNEIISGVPSVSSKMQLHIYDENGAETEKIAINGFNTTPSETGITLYTKDTTSSYDLTGYTVYVGKYTICRVSNGSKAAVFVKGSIQSSRPGKELERPILSKSVTNDDGTTSTVVYREFYLATKDASFAEKLTAGTNVKCQYDYTGDWSNVTQSVGYVYKMLDNGVSKFQNSTEAFIYTDHPRTFIGFKADGTPVFMVVDGRGKTAAEKNFGVSLFEGAEIMKLAGCVNAYNLDGGGSSTLIVRNDAGGFNVINRPSDGGERSTGNAVFMVMRDPSIFASSSTPTSITLNKEKSTYASTLTDMQVTVDGKTYPFEGDTITISGLEMNTKFDVKVSYKHNGEECKSNIFATTKDYNPGLDFNATHNSFKITRRQTDPVLKLISATFDVNGEKYEMGDVDQFVIDDLYKDTKYQISYTYTVLNTETNQTYTRTKEAIEYSTLSYEIPSATEFEAEKNERRSRISVEYRISDVDGLMTKAYVLFNGVIYEISNTRGTLNFDGLDFTKTYKVQLVIEYTLPSGIEKTTSTEEILFEPHVHTWSEATCTDPQKCTGCGEEQGAPLGHSMTNATCTEGSKCSICGTPNGSSLGHNWQDATEEAPKTCLRCGATEGSPLEKEEPKKGCKKSAISTIVFSMSILACSLYLVKRKK